MMTLKQFSKGVASVPTATAWSLEELGQAMGRQELFTRQSPQKLKALREHALIESAISSNRIEGVEVDQKRIGTLVFGKPLLRDREEEEVRGYRDALNLVHKRGSKLQITEKNIRQLHKMIRGDIWDAGRYKDRDGDIIEKYADGRQRVRFRPTPAKQTPAAMAQLVEYWARSQKERWIPPLVAMAAFNLDFLCIHPFRDGNGRVSRLLLLQQSYHCGMEVGRYISLERVIEENKERYYETLEESSRGWHEGKHNPWPYVNYLLFIVKLAYKEFEGRVGQLVQPRGAKTELIERAIESAVGPFTVADLQRECPGVGVDLIRKILKQQRDRGRLRCISLGRSAAWQKKTTRKA